MNAVEILGLVLPALLIVASIFGIFSKDFQDNLIQRVALCGLIITCVIRMALVGERGVVDLSDIALYVVLICYTVGVACKVRRFVPSRQHNTRRGDALLRSIITK